MSSVKMPDFQMESGVTRCPLLRANWTGLQQFNFTSVHLRGLECESVKPEES